MIAAGKPGALGDGTGVIWTKEAVGLPRSGCYAAIIRALASRAWRTASRIQGRMTDLHGAFSPDPGRHGVASSPLDKRPVVFLVNELGGGFGHIRRLLTVAERLAAETRPVLFVPNPVAPPLAGCPFPCLAIPPQPARRPPPPRFGLADVLTLSGYTEPAAIEALLAGWDERMERLRPALFIGDSAPSARLASLGRVPFVAIGDGYVLPPAHRPMPRRVGSAPLEDDAAVLARYADVQARRGHRAPPNLTALWCGTRDVVCTYPTLDPYQAHRQAAASGPLTPPPPPLPPATHPALFAYLAPTAKGGAAFAALARLDLPTRVYVRDAAWTAPPGADHLTVLTEPGDLRAEMAAASLIVHHGGNGTTETVLALGRPQLLLPNHLEQALTADRLRRCGVGAVPWAWEDPLALAQAMTAAAVSEPLAQAAQSLARSLPPMEPAVEVIRRKALALIQVGAAIA